MAFHGGALEQRTDVIARMAAEASGASLYTVELPGTGARALPVDERACGTNLRCSTSSSTTSTSS